MQYDNEFTHKAGSHALLSKLFRSSPLEFVTFDFRSVCVCFVGGRIDGLLE